MTAQEFNGRYPVGSVFRLGPLWTGTETRTKAFDSGKRTLVFVEGVRSAVDVRRLEEFK